MSENALRLARELPLTSKLQTGWRTLFLPRALIGSNYGVTTNSSKLWLYYLIRIAQWLPRGSKLLWQQLWGGQRLADFTQRQHVLLAWLEQ